VRFALASVLVLALAAPAAAAGPQDIEVTATKVRSPRLTEVQFTTPALNFPGSLYILTPKGYDPKARTRYPVLYLLHGSFDTEASWITKGDAEKITEDAKMIVVIPPTAGTGDAGGWASDWWNEGEGGSPMWETFTIRDLIPWVDANYDTVAARHGRAIAGLSMGGFSAMSYAVRHPDLFATSASYSGAVDTGYAPAQAIVQAETLSDGGATPDSIWGPRLTREAFWRAHNPTDLAANLRGMEVAVRTGNGQTDSGIDPIEFGVHDMSIALHTALDGLGIAHVWDDYGAGGHTWDNWQSDLRKDVPRFEATFATPAPDRPERFTYTSLADKSFSVYGWDVELDGVEPIAGTLKDAGAAGFELTTPGKVTTAPYYRPRSAYPVTAGGKTSSALSDGRGRLSLKASGAVTVGKATCLARSRVKLRLPRGAVVRVNGKVVRRTKRKGTVVVRRSQPGTYRVVARAGQRVVRRTLRVCRRATP
jgi:S-formylglutathione hydrolase FrmB